MSRERQRDGGERAGAAAGADDSAAPSLANAAFFIDLPFRARTSESGPVFHFPPGCVTMWTVGELLGVSSRFLGRKGVPLPRLEAEILLAHALGTGRVDLYAGFSKPLDDGEVDLFRELVQRRIRGEPTAYITGSKEFFSLDFKVSEAVLIPRPETEELVQAALDAIDAVGEGKGARGRLPRSRDEEIFAADIGTGSGCIAITLAVLRKELRLFATDISGAALAVARENARRHAVEERISFLEGNLADPLLAVRPEGGFHVITCNPPYIDPDGPLSVDPGVSRFEPAAALFTPRGDPLRYYRDVLGSGRGLLAPSGRFLFEVAMGMAEAVADLGRGMGYAVFCRRADLAGVDRVVGFALSPEGLSRRTV